MKKIVITSKTRMTTGYCVGGYDVSSNKYVRLLTSTGKNQGYDTQFEIGESWRIRYESRQNVTPPHVEDVIVTKQQFIKRIPNLSDYLQRRVVPYTGCITGLFDNKLGFTGNGSPYISQSTGLPDNSVGFWLTTKELCLVDGKPRYKVKDENYEVKYVGLQPTVDSIPAGTLVRVSLARWWSPFPEELEERCYMQISGWY